MEQPKVLTSRLFVTSVIESKRDEIEEKLEQGYSTVQALIVGLSVKEAHDALNSAISRDKAHEETVCLGLLCIILSEPQNANDSYRDLTMVTRDGFNSVVHHLSLLVVEKWLRMNDVARSQLLWLLRKLVSTSVASVDNVCYNLMRHVVGGDVSPRNIALVDYMLDMFIEYRDWLDKHPVILTAVVYNYLRLIEDHSAPQHLKLRQKETTFVVSLLREKFLDCMSIGRDLVRLLQNVARIPEFELLWRDLLNDPKSLCPSFTGVLQLLQTRTSRRFLQGRLTPEMERKIVFLTSHVRFGNHKRYQDWFQKQYLSTPESQTLRIDLIRFIVGVIHPTNELLCSDIIPRWAIIGWLLTTCTSHVAAANAKLALFYDWFFFDTDRDNIMNIEPAILVMHHSMRSHPAVTATLLDFLCRIIPSFYPPLSDKVRQGIYTSLRNIIEKRVLPSLHALFDHNRLDKDLRIMIRETFQEFCYPLPNLEGLKVEEVKDELVNHVGGTVGNHGMVNNHDGDPTEPVFSDDESETVHIKHEEEDDDDIPLVYNNTSCHFLKKECRRDRLKSVLIHLYTLRCLLPCCFPFPLPDSSNHGICCKAKVKLKGSPLPDEWRDEEGDFTKGLDGPMRAAVERLHNETDNEAKCEAMEKLVQLVIQDDEADSDTLSSLGQCLCTVLRPMWTSRIFPDTVTDDSIEDSIGRPLFVLFRNLAELSEDDSRRLPLLTVLSEMYSQQQRIGYLLLYYLQASTQDSEEETSKISSGKSQVYKELCETQDKELEAGLLSDLRLCQEEDVNMLCWLVPTVYSQFPQVSVGNTALLHLVVSTVDARQLQDLVFRVVQGRLKMFQEDTFQSVLTASLTWETFEQFCLWQLVTAHGIPINYVLPILPRLQYNTHAEALTAILLMLKQESPTPELVKQVLCRDVKPTEDMFVLSALRAWYLEHEETLAQQVANLLTSCCPHSSPNKRKRGKPGTNPTTEKLLGHLDRLRVGCRQMYKQDCMQKALQQAQATCTDTQKNHFSNLFALVELDDPGRGKGRGRKPNYNKSKTKNYKEISDSSEESSEEEEVVIKLKQAKKRKKTNPVTSDSD